MRAAFIAMLVMSVGACAPDARAPLSASDVTITAAMAGSNTRAAYMTLTNDSDESISLTAARSPQFESVEFHETTIENEVARMRRIAELVIAPGASVRLEPGGKHLMLMRPVTAGAGNPAPLRRGPPETVDLEFYANDELILSVGVTTGES